MENLFFVECFHLGGSQRGEMTSFLTFPDGILTPDRFLKCDHEEADDRIIFYVNNGVKVVEVL